MSFLLSVINGIRKAYRNIRTARNVMEGPGAGVYLVIEKIKAYLLSIIKGFIFQFLIYGLILIVIISSVGVVFQMFSFWKSGDDSQSFDIDPSETKDWSDSLSEADVKGMQELGASIHPKKVPLYAELENSSYLKNVNINIPVEVEVINDGVSGGVTTSYEDYLYTRGNTAYPYRLWWHSIATLDIINDTSDKVKDKKIIEEVEKGLNPIYSWADPITSEYVEGSTYNKTGKYEKVTTSKVKTLTYNYKNGSLTSSNITEVITTKYYPLPFLENVETMFAKYNFDFEKNHNTNTSESHSTDSWTHTYTEKVKVKKKVTVDGKEEIVEEEEEVEVIDEYTTEVTTTYTNTIDSWDIMMENRDFTSKYFDFLNANNIDTRDDPEVMYYMAEYLPQNYDFITQFGEYLEYASLTSIGGFKGGFGGSFLSYDIGDYEITPSELIRKIPLFIQTDPRWGNFPYSYSGNVGHGTIGTSGCGPTSMSMAIVGLGGYNDEIDINGDKVIDPFEATKYSLKKGHRVYGSGTSWSYFVDIGKAVGLNVSQVPPSSWKLVLEALSQGNPVVASMGPGTFTKAGHYITLVGIDATGKIIVNDSNSVARSNQSWSFQSTILPQSKQFWIIKE